MCTPIEVVLDLKDIALYNGVVIKDSESLQYWGKNQVEEIKKKRKKKILCISISPFSPWLPQCNYFRPSGAATLGI